MQIGLVNRVVPVDELRSTTVQLAETIAENAPLTVAACKVAISQVRLPPERRDLGRLAEMIEACFRSEDYREGQVAFAQKRKPRFTGR
jgi:enoyl-CoA hydratase/carnithine racemase